MITPMKSIRFRPLAALALALFLTALAAAAPPAGAIELPGFDRGLFLAGHPDGGWLALTSDRLSATTDVVIEAVRVAPDGTVGETFTTPELHPIEVNVVAAVVAPSGRWLAVWRSELDDFENSRFSAAIFEPDGDLVERLDLEVPDESFKGSPLRTAVAAVAPDGDFLVAWGARTEDTEPMFGTQFVADLFLARFSQNGDRVAGPVVVNQERLGLQLPRDMVADGDSVAILWDSACCLEDDGLFDVHARVFGLSLAPKGDVIEVSRPAFTEMTQRAEALGLRSDGRVTVVWRDGDQPAGAASPVQVVLFRTFEPDGTPAGPATAVPMGFPGAPDATLVLAEATPDGTVWLVAASQPSGPLLARLYTLDGMPIGPAHDTGLRAAPNRFFEAASDPRGRLLIGYGEFAEPAVVTLVLGQAPPEDRALTSPELPGFRVWVLIGSDTPNPRWGAEEPMCLAETLCASGALPGRTEVLVRVPGPKPNDFLWPTMVKLTTSSADVWIEQLSTGEVRHYFLPGASPGNDVLNGLFDRTGFRP
jgi:hypothetical protein